MPRGPAVVIPAVAVGDVATQQWYEQCEQTNLGFANCVAYGMACDTSRIEPIAGRADRDGPELDEPWPRTLYRALRSGGVEQVAYVPDAGHGGLINLMLADDQVHSIVLTTEEEGVAIASGAWLGGQRSVLLTQSSGVGNCINTLSLISNCRFPLLMLVTMRGEWAEFNPWQMPMGGATEPALQLMGVKTYRVNEPNGIEDTITSAITLAFEAGQAVAVLLSQQMLGRKVW